MKVVVIVYKRKNLMYRGLGFFCRQHKIEKDDMPWHHDANFRRSSDTRYKNLSLSKLVDLFPVFVDMDICSLKVISTNKSMMEPMDGSITSKNYVNLLSNITDMNLSIRMLKDKFFDIDRTTPKIGYMHGMAWHGMA